jgi:hypothetical protein
MSNRRLLRTRASRRALAIALGCSTVALGGCGDTLQDQPIPHNVLENLIVAPYPVYWLGGAFQGMAITEAARDPSGAFSVQYGDCTEGGQSTCVPPLRVVTSPDNSFLPAGSVPRRTVSIRGITSVVAQGGQTIEIPTGGVVVGIYAENPRLARAAATTIVPINDVGVPGARLPPPLSDTGFAETPLPNQTPAPLRTVR